MKILLVAHGYPPELVGGTESSVAALARALADGGDEVRVCAGSLAAARAGEPVSLERSRDGRVEVVRLLRADLHFDHWHKSASPAAAKAFRALVREFAPDVVHLHHWIRLSRDLVAQAAREGVPSVFSLHDFWTTCPIAFRVRPDTLAVCDAAVGPHPCIACAAKIGPKTPWVATESAFMLLAERQRDLARELELARAISVPSASHRALLERFGALRAADPRVHVLAPRAPTTFAALGGTRAIESLAPPQVHGALVLGVWGHLMEHKGQDLVLEALDRAPEIPFEVHFAGAEASPQFAARLRERARGRNVQFHGAYDSRELARIPAARVHAVIVASRARESYSLIVDEARALGLPCLVADHGALSARAGEGGLLTFAANDAAALARSIERLWREPALFDRLRQEVLALGSVHADEGAWSSAWRELYTRAIALGAPKVAEPEWFEARLRQAFIDEWDRSLRARANPGTNA